MSSVKIQQSLKILFVSSGNASGGISTIVKYQGESLITKGLQVEFFTIKGKGLYSYIHHIFILRNFLKNNKFDIIHAHYSLTAFLSSFAGARPLVVSLMGSDVLENKFNRILLHIFQNCFWKEVIVKSKEMAMVLNYNRTEIIPNGVNINHFRPLDKTECLRKIGWDPDKKHLLFSSNPKRPEKNYSLFERSIDLLPKNYNFVLHVLSDISYQNIPFWINAADILILSSLHEGSPNVIKEAMSCNCPIVSTNVGDVKWVIGETEGCFISSFNEIDFAQSIKKGLDFGKKTNGRERIVFLGLDSESIAIKIIGLYLRKLNL